MWLTALRSTTQAVNHTIEAGTDFKLATYKK